MQVDLQINEIIHTLALESRRTLLDALRYDLQLTGTKKVRDMGDCGACTVLIDGQAMYACLLLAVDCDGRAITTIEGLAHHDELSPVQRAFTVLRVAAAHDCGRIINPTTVESQIIGGVTQGVGFALTEERFIDQRTGIVLNANLEEYKVPTVADIPVIIHAPVDLPDTAANPTGAKGIGEPPLIPTAPAIANAVFAATGVRLRHAPLTRRALLDALREDNQHG